MIRITNNAKTAITIKTIFHGENDPSKYGAEVKFEDGENVLLDLIEGEDVKVLFNGVEKKDVDAVSLSVIGVV